MELERSTEMITLNKEDAFTIVDIISKAQEIIRCKDCKYSREAMPMVKGQYECGYVLGVRTADDFCSRGEKK